MSNSLEKLIVKYFTDSLSPAELSRLSDLLKDVKKQQVFEEYTRNYYDLNSTLQRVNLDETHSDLLGKIEWTRRHNKFSYKKWYKIAAVFIAIIGMSHFLFLTFNDFFKDKIDDNEITLTLENGDVKVILEGDNENIVNNEGLVVGKQEGTKLIYRNNKNASTDSIEDLVYNELAVPYGKTFRLTLSDGTLVHLNAGTTIRYPVKFLENGDRQIYLNGEAYFEVAHDKDHPFIANTKEMKIRVLGTSFNISSYNEDSLINTVLIEGSVALYKNDEVFDDKTSISLVPGQVASWDKVEKQLQISESDIDEYIAWTRGKLLFKVRPFSEIRKVLERHYNISIINNYKFLDDQRFFAKFDTETIEQVLISFQSGQPFSFEINGSNILINEP